MKKQVKHIILDSLRPITWEIKTKHNWMADYLFYDGSKWRQDIIYFVHKPEFDRLHRLFETDCCRIKGD